MHVWALELWCETPAALGPSGLHTTTRELQTCTFDGPGASKHHQKTTRRHTVREKKSETGGGRRKKKREILGLPPFGAPPFGAPPFGARFFLGLGPTLWAMTHTRSRNGLAKIGLAQIGQIRMAKTGLAKVGPFR